jgi:2-oxoglutarate ferredoxin oxidoreductase subunit gamma
MARLTEIRVAGFGGQGVILCAMVVGKAYAVYEGGFATLTQSFGPEARGGACSAQVITSDEPVLYPYVAQPDILVVMSQEAFSKFSPDLKEGGMLLVEEDLVQVGDLKPGTKLFRCPATRIAEQLGKRMVLNIVMVGFFAAVTGLVKQESLRQAVAESVPEHFKDVNLVAFDKGYEYGLSQLQAAQAVSSK